MAVGTRVRRIADLCFGLMALIYVAVFSSLMVLKHQTFHTGYDFAIYDQIVWNSLHGRALESSITTFGATWLGTHFAPILLALVPVYAVWSDPRALLIFQTIALAVTALPIYWLARQWLGSLLALCISVSFFSSPLIQNINLAEFHDVALAAPLLSFATYFAVKERMRPFGVCLGVALLTKEDIAFIPIMFGLWFILRRRVWFGIALSVSGVMWAMLVLQYVIPFFAEASGNAIISLHFSSFGNSLPEVIASLLLKPDHVWQVISASAKLDFLLALFIPLAFLALIGIELTLLGLPTLGYLLLLPELSIHSNHHLSSIAPFLFFGAILGLKRLTDWGVRFEQKLARQTVAGRDGATIQIGLAGLVLVFGLAGYYWFAPGPFARNFHAALFMPDAARVTLARDLMATIPPDAALLTTGALTPHLSQRAYIKYFPFVKDYRPIEYVFFDHTSCAWCYTRLEVLPAEFLQPVYDHAGFFIARRRPWDQPLDVRFENRLTLTGFTLTQTEALVGGHMLLPVLGWQVEHGAAANFLVHVFLVDRWGHDWAMDSRPVPVFRTAAGKEIRDQYILRLPPTMPAGVYDLRVAVDRRDTASRLRARETKSGVEVDQIGLGTRRIEKNKSNWTAKQLIEQGISHNLSCRQCGSELSRW